MDDMNNLTIRCTAGKIKCSDKGSGDIFYINGTLPGAYTPEGVQTESCVITEGGVFAVFSGVDDARSGCVKSIDNFAESIIKFGKAAVDACIAQLNEELAGCDYSFAMLRISGSVCQIFFRGSSRVYICRGGKALPLTNAAVDDSGDIKFSPEFKLLENDSLLICTDGVFEKLNTDAIKQIFEKTTTSKAAACSLVLSSYKSGCRSDATAIVLRAKKEAAAVSDIPADITLHSRQSAPMQSQSPSHAKAAYQPAEKRAPHRHREEAAKETNDTKPEIMQGEYLGMNMPSWLIIGALTVALGIITGLIVLIFI